MSDKPEALTGAVLKVEAYRCTWDEGGTGSFIQFFEPHELPADDEWHAEDPPDETLALVTAVDAGEKIKALAKIGAENFAAAVEARDAADTLTQQVAELHAECERLERYAKYMDETLAAYKEVSTKEAAELAEWRKLRDPATLHVNLLRGIPARLDDATLWHMAGGDQKMGELRDECERLRADATFWQSLYRRAVNEANGLTNYVEDRPELRSAERKLEAIQAEARARAARKEQA